MAFTETLTIVAVFIFLIWIFNSVNVIKEWERGVILRLGRMSPEPKGGGAAFRGWPIDKLTKISLRIETLDVPPQDVITRDNVSVKVNAVCYFRVVDANLRAFADAKLSLCDFSARADEFAQRDGAVRIGRDFVRARKGKRQVTSNP